MGSAVLVLCISMLSIGCLVGLNIISALAPVLGPSEVSTIQFWTFLGAALTFPIVGHLATRIAWPTVGVSFAGLLFAASLLLALSEPSSWVFSGSRFLFGIGFAALFVVQDAVLMMSFQRAALTVAFTTVLVLDRFAEVATFNVGAYLEQQFGSKTALWVPFCVGGVAVLASIIMLRLVSGSPQPEQPQLWRVLRRQSPRFWMLVAITALVYSAWFPFSALGTDYLKTAFQLDPAVPAEAFVLTNLAETFQALVRTAPGVLTLIHLTSIPSSLFLMWLVRHRGRRGELMLVGTVVLATGFLWLTMEQQAPIRPIIALGLGLAITVVPLWPAFAILSRDPSAYVLASVPQYLGMALFVRINGLLRTTTESYFTGLVLSAALLAAATVLAVLLLLLDRRSGRELSKPDVASEAQAGST